jgi:hypothetical protein
MAEEDAQYEQEMESTFPTSSFLHAAASAARELQQLLLLVVCCCAQAKSRCRAMLGRSLPSSHPLQMPKTGSWMPIYRCS